MFCSLNQAIERAARQPAAPPAPPKDDRDTAIVRWFRRWLTKKGG